MGMAEAKRRLVALTGAGMSAESGIKTFRDAGGLWEEHRVEDVASIEGWHRDPELMTRFYDERRAQLEKARPNRGHEILAELEQWFDVGVVTQNVDDLHERAGSTQVLHLHGELTKVRSERDPERTWHVGYAPVRYGTRATEAEGFPGGDGSLIRPHIVWFGEAVPMISEAARWVRSAEIFVVIGSSLVVYPAAGLIHELRGSARAFLIDPKEVSVPSSYSFEVIRAGASEGMATLRDRLLASR